MSEVLFFVRELLTPILKAVAHDLVKQLLLHVKKRTAPAGKRDGSFDAVND